MVETDRMLLIVNILAIVVGFSSGGAGAWEYSTAQTIGREAPHSFSRPTPAECIGVPERPPTSPRPVILCLTESGIDEEDSHKLDTPSSVTTGFGGGVQPLAGVSPFYSSLNRLGVRRSAAPAVLRC